MCQGVIGYQINKSLRVNQMFSLYSQNHKNFTTSNKSTTPTVGKMARLKSNSWNRHFNHSNLLCCLKIDCQLIPANPLTVILRSVIAVSVKNIAPQNNL